RERLVQFNYVQLVELEASLFKNAASCRHRSDSHDPRWNSRRGRTQHTRDRVQSMFQHGFFGRQEDGCSTVIDARRVASRNGAIRLDDRFQLRERTMLVVAKRVLVLGDDDRFFSLLAGKDHWSNFFCELSVPEGSGCALLAAKCK